MAFWYGNHLCDLQYLRWRKWIGERKAKELSLLEAITQVKSHSLAVKLFDFENIVIQISYHVLSKYQLMKQKWIIIFDNYLLYGMARISL